MRAHAVKVVLLLIALGAVVPVGLALRRAPRLWPLLATVMGVLPFFHMEALSLNFFYDYDVTIQFRGEARGVEITILDLVSWILWVAMGPGAHKAPFRLTRYFYVATLLVSVAVATLPVYALFSVVRLLRAFLVLGAVSRLAEDPRLPPHVIRGMAAGVLWAFLIALYQKFGGGLDRVFGPFPHPNTFAMAANVVFAVCFALVLAGQGGLLAMAASAAAGLAVILTLSRTSTALLGGVAASLVALSFRGGVTRRKVFVAVGGALAALALFAVMSGTIIDRFLNAPAISGEARELFNQAAKLMVADHPLGVGVNNFSYVLLHDNYASRVGLPEVDASGIAHHIYWLTLAEVGYLGLFAYVLMCLAPVLLALRTAFRARKSVVGDVALGLGMGLVTLHLQGFTEWAIRQPTLTYLHWMVAGLVTGLAREAGVLRDRRR